MIGVILAAGRGSRLGGATSALPKPLLPIDDRVCLDFSIEALLPVASRVVVVTGYMADQVEAHLAARWAPYPVQAVRNGELEAGNLTSLRAARPELDGSAFIVTNADHLFPASMYTEHFRPGDGVRIACENHRPIQADEMKVVNGGGRLKAIAKTLESFDGAYIGTTVVGDDALATYWQAFDRVATTRDLGSASVEMVLDHLAGDGAAAPQVCWMKGLHWYEVDTPQDLSAAREGLLA